MLLSFVCHQFTHFPMLYCFKKNDDSSVLVESSKLCPSKFKKTGCLSEEKVKMVVIKVIAI